MLGARSVLRWLGRGLLQAPGGCSHFSSVETQCRLVHTGSQKLQEVAEESNSTELTHTRHSEDFSILPPMPGQESHLRWGNKKYEDLHIVHIKATYNNTHIQVTTQEGQSMVRTSCGTEGFKNAKKGTPIAAQTAGISAAVKAIDQGISFVRVVVKGLGPGRLSAIKGLSMGGLQVVSITDNTPIPHNGCRPRKARRM
ncbi:28S ribosomal protein S11, mitochondrial isoform X2 [Scyliorhinus canicula]|uniref:28S ribosomal protein S11, mitochondrial isoform X2 n=1 Tax=Scyliorhinus canicula TaxID=7830 RepID=UPI0018F623F3|nr:28S ribosomal protein S11, mitochondrial isoform X2 [Scyliorhinus canicula]